MLLLSAGLARIMAGFWILTRFLLPPRFLCQQPLVHVTVPITLMSLVCVCVTVCKHVYACVCLCVHASVCAYVCECVYASVLSIQTFFTPFGAAQEQCGGPVSLWNPTFQLSGRSPVMVEPQGA